LAVRESLVNFQNKIYESKLFKCGQEKSSLNDGLDLPILETWKSISEKVD
jgi:hypothetical protein